MLTTNLINGRISDNGGACYAVFNNGFEMIGICEETDRGIVYLPNAGDVAPFYAESVAAVLATLEGGN